MDNRSIMISVGVGAVLLIWAVVFLPSSGDEHRAPRAAPPPAEADEPRTGASAPPPAPPSEVAQQAKTAPVAPAQAAPAQPAAAPDAPPPTQQRPQKMGPFEELKATYEGEARDPEAGATEERIRTLLQHPDVPAGMLRNLSCVKTACKLELRWTSNDLAGYMTLMMLLVSNVSEKLAAAPIGPDEGQPTHPIEVYVSRIEPPLTPQVK